MVRELRAMREQAERIRIERLGEQQQVHAGPEHEQLQAEHVAQLPAVSLDGQVETEVRQEARRLYPQPSWLITKDCINVAVTGNSGVGKSSFINTMRGLRPRDEGAADVSLNETTMQPTGYDFPGTLLPTKLWDLPGAGTQRFPREGYVESMGLRYFDVVIIVTATRYTETEVMIAEALHKFSVPHFMVRNKVDSDIANNEDDHGISAKNTVQSVREDMQRQGVPRPYLLSSKFSRRDEFDMEQLKKDALQAVCDAREVPHDCVQHAPRELATHDLPTPTRAAQS